MQTRFHLWLARIISHEENALAILNGPALKWAAVAAALVMGLPILQQIPGITIAYICLVLIGVDVQYIACVRNAAEALTNKTRIMWSIVAGVLFIPVFQTNAVFSLHAQTGIDELSAMHLIHLSSTGWGIERALLIALLMGVSALSRPKQHSTIATVAPAPTPAPTLPPTAPDNSPNKPKASTSRPRRNTGRTEEETQALKRLVTPKVVALRNAGTPYQAIADQLDITKFMVQQILKDDKRATAQEVA